MKKKGLAAILVLAVFFSFLSSSFAMTLSTQAIYGIYLDQKVSLKKGSKGKNVQLLTSNLGVMNYGEEADLNLEREKYDSVVEKAVKSFQGINNLKMTGKITPEEFAQICARRDCTYYDIERILVPNRIWWVSRKNGNRVLGFDILNCSTKYTVDAYDFYLKGYNVYGEEVLEEVYYSHEKCKIAPLKRLSGKKQYWIIPCAVEPYSVKFAISRFHTKEKGTIKIPYSELRWWTFDGIDW